MRGPKVTLTLQTYSSTSDGQGGFTRTWSDSVSIKGTLLSYNESEFIGADKKTVSKLYRFFVKYDSNITINSKDRFALGSRTFEIEAVDNVGELNRHWEISLKELD
jgi:SPP1 family predicted phage head-tail adaptor